MRNLAVASALAIAIAAAAAQTAALAQARAAGTLIQVMRGSIFRDVSSVSLWDGLRAVRLKLWDADAARLVTWKEHRRANSRARANNLTT